MNKDKIKVYIENQFVEDYEHIHKFMLDVNETLTNMNFETYKTYNEFCLDIEKSIIDTYEDSNINNITTNLIVNALNNMVKYKIIADENYEEKIREYFDDPESVLNDINKLKLKKY
jgi:hypothetical protein